MASRRALCVASAMACAAAWAEGRVRAAEKPAATGASKGASPTASASIAGAPKELVGAVMKLDAGDVVIDLGASRGVAVGDLLELWRPITVKYPVTGKLLKDKFRIGALRVTQTGDVLSLAKADGVPTRPIEPGDVVVRPAPIVATTTTVATTGTSETTATTPPIDETPENEGDPEAGALSKLFDGLRGADLSTRVAKYRAWVKAHPKSRFAPVLVEEANALAAIDGATANEAVAIPIEATQFEKPDDALAGRPLVVGVEVSGPATGVVVHVRGVDEPAFTTFAMHAEGPGYWAATLPADRMRAPGVEIFLEAVDTKGAATPIVGDAHTPLAVRVVVPPKAEPPKSYESTFAMWTDYADYNRLRGNDYAWQTEGWFGMRFGDVGLRAVRSGFGVYKGKGGGLDDLDTRGLAPRSIGLTYGYVEAEWGFTPIWSLVTRGVVGLGEDGVTGGAQGFVRIGNDKKTNLLVGFEVLGGVGIRGITQVELNVFPRFPIVLRSEVTNQPAGVSPTGDRFDQLTASKQSTDTADLGVRAIAQVGWRVTSSLGVFVRASYQGRTINHAGPGAGAGVMFSW